MTDPMTPFSPNPIALESAAIVAFGHAKDDVARAAQRFREAAQLEVGILSAWDTMCAALDRLTALGWVPGPERVGTALAGSGEAVGWRPIETAPKDGTRILLYQPGGDGEDPLRTVAEGSWLPTFPEACGWLMESGDEWTGPTHWRSLPDPPGSLTGPGDGG